MVRLKQFTSSLKNVIYPLTALFAATMFICCSYASLGSVFALKLKQLETPTSIAGLILAMYYMGCVVASFSASGIMASENKIEIMMYSNKPEGSGIFRKSCPRAAPR